MQREGPAGERENFFDLYDNLTEEIEATRIVLCKIMSMFVALTQS